MVGKEPKVSIIVPCYNLGDYLTTCLESIDRQPVDDVEYVFVNDGSTDDTQCKLEAFCENNPSCKLINQPNSGVSSARNAALKEVTGEYVYLLDGDDILTDTAVHDMLDTVKNSDCDAVLSGAEIVEGRKVRKINIPLACGIYSGEELYTKINYFPTIPQLLYKTEIIRNHNLQFDTSLHFGEVYDFTIRFLCFAKKIKIVDYIYFKYVMRGESASHAPNYKRDLTVISTLEKYLKCGGKFVIIPSFKVTAFKMIMSFTYNKYVKLGLTNHHAIDNIKKLLSNRTVNNLIKEVAKTPRVSLKEKILANYISMTGIKGYKVLASLIKMKK